MDRIHQIRDEAARSKDITLDTSSLPSESFLTANESSSSFYSITEEDSTFIVSPSKDSSSTSNAETSIADANLICNLSPIQKSNEIESFKIGKQIEAANILSGGVNIFDDNSYDGDELVIDDNPVDKEIKGEGNEDKTDNTLEAGDVSDAIPSKETEVVLQIDGKNVDAIDIGNGLYLYRKTGEEELAAVQIIDDDQQQQSFKFLKVRENAEGNLEVYEEIEIEVPKEAPIKEGKPTSSTSQTSTKDANKINHLIDKVVEITENATQNDLESDECKKKELEKASRDVQESKSELNFNGKTMKFNESRKSPVIGTFTPMTYHSTQYKEGRPLTKTMVDQHLQPNRHSDNIKKTIEVNTENCKQKVENVSKYKDENDSKNESNENDTKHTIETKDIMSSTINDTVETKHDESITSEIKKNYTEIQDTEVKDKFSDMSNEIKPITDDIKITPDAISLPNIPNNSENTVKLINQDLCNETDSNVCNSTQSVSTLVTDTDNTETDVEDKLVIAEESIICDVSNEPITKPIEINPLAGPKSNSERIVSDLDRVLESCENIVKTIEETKKCEQPESEVKELNINNKEITIIDKGEYNADENKIEAIDKKLDDKGIKLDSTQTDKTSPHNTVEKNKTQEQKSAEPTIITENKGCPIQPIPNKDFDLKSNRSKPLNFDVKMSANNNSNLKQSTDKESNHNELSQQKITSNSFSVNSQIDLKIENPSQFSTMKEQIPSIEQKSEPKTEEKKDLDTGKSTENKGNAKACPAVPFGKWTEANRQEFLNKIKESKVTTSNSHTKQIKQPNDLNRRDFLKKIDNQRQTNSIAAKNQDNASNKLNIKPSSMNFKNTARTVEIPTVPELPKIKEAFSSNSNSKTKPITEVTNSRPEIPQPIVNKLILAQRKEINNQDLIDKTIEGIINRALPAKATQEDKPNIESKAKEITNSSIITLDDIERKMNELHGIPFVERPSHELPGLNDTDNLCDTKKENTVIPYTNKHHQKVKDSERANISEEEIIEHEPITGDIAIAVKDRMPQQTVCNNGAKKDSIITEKDFDKFARRNSVTYENCLTVNFDKREPCNVTQSIVSKDIPIKKMSRNELMLAESKAKSTHKHYLARHSVHSSKIPTAVKSMPLENTASKNYQSKVQMAYQTALTAKQKQEPITIIEDKPVKVVFMDTNAEFGPLKLNVQGQELSPSSKPTNDNIHSTSESVDSDIIETIANQNKLLENKSKVKHQRKQVLTPVEAPELELIEPKDLGLQFSPKKKRKVDEKSDKKSKSLVPKKSYLLNRNTEVEKQTKAQDRIKTSDVETIKRTETYVVHSDPISAIDNLVKAAELLETQSENKILNSGEENETKIEQTTPVKRGRGRPRKYPLPGTESDLKKPVSPHKEKKPEQNNANNSLTETEEDSTDDEMIKENWTMGKINENIVCPICNKLFRSENVVFKHVKHCTGPSPNRSESDKRSSRRLRNSNDSKGFSLDSNSEDEIITPRKRKSRDSKPASKYDDGIKTSREISEKAQLASKQLEKKEVKVKSKLNNLVCELCGKTFRQLSYLLSHKLQHKREEAEKLDKMNKNVFCCEVCKKEFRKLHHLVQHRLIHDPKTMTARLSRKTSSETNENKQTKTQAISKEREDHSTGFRCEPCDKSFRKLHHLVEHRETHDGINKKSTSLVTDDAVNTPTLHQCDICNKTFKKLQHLMEHKDQHLETSSEKSDDKSVQSSLSTRDIIHECSLCYMVFPNEHSLNRHFVNCQRKKKQSAAKQLKTGEEVVVKEEVDSETDNKPNNNLLPEIIKPLPSNEVNLSQDKLAKQDAEKEMSELVCETEEKSDIVDDSDNKSDDLPLVTKKSDVVTDTIKLEKNIKPAIKKEEIETIVIPDTPTPKKRTAAKEKIGITVTKKQKISVLQNIDKKVESSDDDEVRYMLNPEYQDNNLEDKFMKVRAEKRSSLQIERPNSKDLMKRRISLQHPPKILRLKTKVEAPPIQSVTVKKSKSLLKTASSSDSDDSDVKYAFPETVADKPAPKIVEGKKKSVCDKRKSLPGVAKRKSLGKQKINPPVKTVRRRTEVEHRCDCGQLFSSAALLSRHTTLAHTPPRIRKRRSPPPDNPKPKLPKPSLKPPKQTLAQKLTTHKQTQKQNTQIKTQVKKLRKSSDKPSDDKDTRRTALRGAPEKSRKIK